MTRAFETLSDEELRVLVWRVVAANLEVITGARCDAGDGRIDGPIVVVAQLTCS